MNIVEAVDTDEIKLVERKFRLNGWHRTGDIWRIGVNLALRITDLLSIRYDQIHEDYLKIREGKTGKKRKIRINNTAREIINKRRHDNPEHIYLFQSDGNRVANRSPKPVSRQYITKHFSEVGQELGLELGTHSMRKSRGKAMFDAGRPLEEISKVLNHSSPGVTLRYIGITQERIDRTYTDFEL